jgi:ribosome assembly protein 4
VSEDNGKPLAPAVNLPSNVLREGLEVLVNKLSTQVSLLAIEMRSHSNPSNVRMMKPVLFQFHVLLPADATSPGAPTRIISIEADVLSHPTQEFTEEDVFVVMIGKGVLYSGSSDRKYY